MAKYIIEGQPIETQDDLTEAEIEQIAAELGGKQAKAPMPGAVQGAQAAAQIPLQTLSAPASIPEAPGGFKQGILDPFRGGSQLVAEGLGMLGSKWGKSEAARMQESITAQEKEYKAGRAAAGEAGFDWARVGGNVLSPANLAALPAKGASNLYSLLKSGLMSGAMEPVVSGEGKTFTEQKAKQVGAGVVGGVVGSAATKIAGEALNPLVSKAEQTMKDTGVTMTPGQLAGGQAKAIEEFAANLPLVGKYISNAKERTLFSFNKGVTNKALAKVGEKLPADVIGRDAVQFANDIVDTKYGDVLSKIDFKLDFPTYTNLLGATRLPSNNAARVQVQDILNSTVYSKLPQNRTIKGELYKEIESDLRKQASNYTNSTLASEKEVGRALFKALDGLKGGLYKQHPQKTSELRRIDSAYGDLAVMKQAAAAQGAENGVFTPRQYAAAVRQRDVTRGKSKYAAGLARGQDVSDAALQVLEKDAGSTLEGRLAMQASGAWSLLNNLVAAGVVAAAAPIMYSESGIKAMNTIMRSRPEVAKKIGSLLTNRATKEGSITGANVLEEYQRSLKTEEEPVRINLRGMNN